MLVAFPLDACRRALICRLLGTWWDTRRVNPRAVLARLLAEGTAVARSDGSVHSLFPVAVGAAEGAALQAWVRREGTRRTIEIGLGYGIATLHILAGLLENDVA